MTGAFNPVKPRDPGTPKHAVSRLFDQAGGLKRVAVLMPDVRKSQLYAYTDDRDEAQMRFVDVAALTRPGCDAAAEYLAMLAGGVFLPLPEGDGAIHADLSKAALAHGEAVAVLARALGDGKLTPAEARQALDELDDAVRTVAQLRARVLAVAEGGDGS